MSVEAATVREARKAAVAAAHPAVFPAVVAFALLVLVAALLYFDRLDRRERDAQLVKAIEGNTAALVKLTAELTDAPRPRSRYSERGE